MKRSSSPSDPASGVADSSASNNGNHKRSKVSSICDYNGYSFQKQKPEIETVKSSELTALQFFDRFISQRKPCILHPAPSETMLDATWKMTPQTLVDVAGQEVSTGSAIAHKTKGGLSHSSYNRWSKSKSDFRLKNRLVKIEPSRGRFK